MYNKDINIIYDGIEMSSKNKELSPKVKACLEFAQESKDAREGRLTTNMLAEELIGKFFFEPDEKTKAVAVASSFVNKYCEEKQKGIMEPRIPKHYKLKFEHFK